MTTRVSAQAGFALITALWAALILALLAAYALEASRTSARAARTATAQASAQAEADAAIAATELRLLAPIVSGIPLDGTPIHDRSDGFHVEVRVQDQAGLIDLDFVDGPTLRHVMMEAGGLDLDAAQTMTDRVLDWRERGPGRRLQGAKAADYAAAGLSYGPREASFESVGELKLVLGMTAALYARLAPLLTVYSQKAVVDVTVAPEAVLRALPGFDEDSITALLGARQAQEAAGKISYGDLTGRCLRISVAVSDGNGRVAGRARVVRLTGMTDPPFWTYAASEESFW